MEGQEKQEVKIEKKDNSQKKLIVVIILLLLVIASMGVYIAYEKGVIFTSTETKDNKSNNKANINKKNDKTKTEKEEDTVNDIEKPLDLSKCLNNSATYTNQTDIQGDYGLSMSVNQDKKSITLSIDWSKFGPLSTASTYSSSVEQYQITGFTKNISTAFVGDYGQDSTGITLFYLMEDGTVEYTSMFVTKTDASGNKYFDMDYVYDVGANNTMSNEHFVTRGQLAGVEKVVKLYTADFSNGTGGRTTIGAKNDGSFYDLGILLNK